jgi:hypothetical protein
MDADKNKTCIIYLYTLVLRCIYLSDNLQCNDLGITSSYHCYSSINNRTTSIIYISLFMYAFHNASTQNFSRNLPSRTHTASNHRLHCSRITFVQLPTGTSPPFAATCTCQLCSMQRPTRKFIKQPRTKTEINLRISHIAPLNDEDQ